MKRFFVGILIIAVLPSGLLADVDPFYLRALEQGKTYYYNSEFEKALESFRVAEFGLQENKERMEEIFLYKALAYYKLKQINRVQETLNRMKTELGILDVSSLTVPPRLKPDVRLLDSVFRSSDKSVKSSGKEPVTQNISLRMSFEKLFQSTLSLVRDHRFDRAQDQLKQLKRLNSRDERIDFLEGLMAFEQKKYTESISILRRVYPKNLGGFRTEVIYTLVIAYYFADNYGQSLAFYQKITDPADQKKLTNIVDKIRAERKRMVQQQALQFSKKGLITLKNRFQGDTFIGRDLLEIALNRFQLNNPILQTIIKVCAKNPEVCNPDFYLLSADYYIKINKKSLAIDILKKNRYYSHCNIENIEICYQTGVVYFKMKKWRNALLEMNKVNAVQKGYKRTDYFIATLNKLLKGG